MTDKSFTYIFANHAGIAIGPILFVIFILAILVAALAAGSGGFGSSTNKDAARVQASSVIQQGNSVKWGFERVYGNAINIDDVILSEAFTATNSVNALYGNNGGGLLPLTPLKAAVPDSGINTWRYVKEANLPDIGNNGANDAAAVLEVRSEGICKAINSIIFGKGSAQETTIPLAAGAASAILNEAGCSDATFSSTASGCNVAANDFDVSASTDVSGRAQACIDDGAGHYYYYQLLLAK